jgi:hypothetical protein
MLFLLGILVDGGVRRRLESITMVPLLALWWDR